MNSSEEYLGSFPSISSTNFYKTAIFTRKAQDQYDIDRAWSQIDFDTIDGEKQLDNGVRKYPNQLKFSSIIVTFPLSNALVKCIFSSRKLMPPERRGSMNTLSLSVVTAFKGENKITQRRSQKGKK